MPMDPWSAAIIEQNRRWLTAYVLSLTGDPGAVDDLIQESFTIAYQKRKSFQPGTNFGGWLRSIARNVTLRHCERRGHRPVVDHREAVAQLDKAAARSEAMNVNLGFFDEKKKLLRECLEKLSHKIRKILRMRYNDGLTPIDIAAAVGAKASAVNTAIFRARLALGDCVRRKEAV